MFISKCENAKSCVCVYVRVMKNVWAVTHIRLIYLVNAVIWTSGEPWWVNCCKSVITRLTFMSWHNKCIGIKMLIDISNQVWFMFYTIKSHTYKIIMKYLITAHLRVCHHQRKGFVLNHNTYSFSVNDVEKNHLLFCFQHLCTCWQVKMWCMKHNARGERGTCRYH